MPASTFAQIALGTSPRSPDHKAHLQELKRRQQRDTESHFASKEGVNRRISPKPDGA